MTHFLTDIPPFLEPIVEQLWQPTNCHTALQQALDSLHQACQVQRCVLLRPHCTGGVLPVQQSAATVYPFPQAVDPLVGYYAAALERGERVCFSQPDPQWPQTLQQQLQPWAIQAACLIPLRWRSQDLGILSLQCDRPRPWHSDDLAAIHCIAHHGAIALYRNSHQHPECVDPASPDPLLHRSLRLLCHNTPSVPFDTLIAQLGRYFNLDRVWLLMNLDEDELWVKYEWCAHAQIPKHQGAKVPQSQFPPGPLDPAQWPVFSSLQGVPPAEPLPAPTCVFNLLISDRTQVYGSLSLHQFKPVPPLEPAAVQTLQAISDAISLIFLHAQTREASLQLSRENHHKSELLSLMSHELRTPLTGILGFAKALLEQIYGPLNAKQHQYLTAIVESGDYLLALINDLLDLSKIEANREELDLEPVEIATLCQGAIAIVQELARVAQLDLQLHLDPHLPPYIADPRRLKQILVNLLANAIKFTPQGSVTLSVTLCPPHLCFAVRDTGIGIAAADLDILFQPFRQLHTPFKATQAGTGLGLALSQKLAQLHHGDIQVESTPNQGSCFTLRLPLDQP
jgi:signal transduction histidine kinase